MFVGGDSDGQEKAMAVFYYEATKTVGPGPIGSGIIVALDEMEAADKLYKSGLHRVRLKQIRGISTLWKWFNADIK